MAKKHSPIVRAPNLTPQERPIYHELEALVDECQPNRLSRTLLCLMQSFSHDTMRGERAAAALCNADVESFQVQTPTFCAAFLRVLDSMVDLWWDLPDVRMVIETQRRSLTKNACVAFYAQSQTQFA